MKELLQEQLQQAGYKIIPTDVAYIGSLFKCGSRAVIILNIVDLESGFAVMRQELDSLNEDIRKLFISKGYFRIEIRNLLLTMDPEKTEKEWGADDRDWMWDLDEHQMYISQKPGSESIELYQFVKDYLYSIPLSQEEEEPFVIEEISLEDEPAAVDKVAAEETAAEEPTAEQPLEEQPSEQVEENPIKPKRKWNFLKRKKDAEDLSGTDSEMTVIDISEYLHTEDSSEDSDQDEDEYSEDNEFSWKKILYQAERLWDMIPVCTILIAAVNILAFLYMENHGSTLNAGFMADHGGLYAPNVWNKHQWYLLLTSSFLHFGFTHLSNNMLVFAIVGTYLEKTAGKLRFLVIYLLSGLGGSILSLTQSTVMHSNTVTAGASGAIFGVIGALLILVILNRGFASGLTGLRIGVLLFISLYYGFYNVSTDNMSHIGGLVTGCIVYFIFYRIQKRREKNRQLKINEYCLPN